MSGEVAQPALLGDRVIVEVRDHLGATEMRMAKGGVAREREPGQRNTNAVETKALGLALDVVVL